MSRITLPKFRVRFLFFLALSLSMAGMVSAQTSLTTEKKVEVSPATPALELPNSPKTANIRVEAAPRAETVSEEAVTKSVTNDSANAQPVTPVQARPPCKRQINADVVALPHAIMLNRLGAAIPDGLIFALASDLEKGKLQLRDGKRARPLVLRANVGDCLKITFTNRIPRNDFLNPKLVDTATTGTTSEVSLHIEGMEWVKGTQDDGSFVGANDSSLASAPAPPAPTPSPMPPQTQEYNLYARAEGTFLLYSAGDTSTQGDQLTRGLFGALNVQPAGAEWYRSQVSADDLLLATYNANRPDQVPPGSLVCVGPNCTFTLNGTPVKVIKTPDFGAGPTVTKGGYLNTLDNHPLIQYDAVYPATRLDGTPIPPALVGTPVLKMLDDKMNIVRSDLTAVITGPKAGRFPGANGNPNKADPACNAENNPALNPPPGIKVDPLFCQNPASPDRKQPYRELTILYHGGLTPIAAQAFPVFTDPDMSVMLTAGQDAFAINYGTGGIGAEVYANRIGVGPMGPCVDCKFEEFFLSAWSVGDPAMLVDNPANSNDLAENPKFQSPCKTTADFSTKPECGGKRVPPLDPPNPPAFPYLMKPKVKATAAFFPDDPSNVYHSYINDHVKFRILHGGRDVTHVHHQHAHQWLQSPNSDESSYLDSQMISPGASYTLEMVYNGSGNRNKVVGDSIFHCHFYPHFAAGMWSMWRTHDVFEAGTFVYPNGFKNVGNQVVPGSRALPDGEIVTGSPNPALVPMPTLPMAPLPAYAQIQNDVMYEGVPIKFGGQIVFGGKCLANQINGMDVIGGCVDGQILNGTVLHSQYDFNQNKLVGIFQPSKANALENPGFPYFIPGVAGTRAPHPPLDFAPDGVGGFMDGGLPRHLVTGGSIKYESHDQFDWSKDLATIDAVKLAEDGTPIEKAAISYFSKRCYPTFFPDGSPGSCPSSNSTPPQTTMVDPPTGFVLNGLPLGPQSGAPFADPAIDDNGKPIGTKRTYKAAAIQLDVTFNKKGWHFPQQRILTLWKDVQPTYDYTTGKPGRQPEPLFFRGNSGDIIEYWHTNLVPNYYLVDDFQVRTPTDILGQHIHLVKFDVTSSDGAGNGFNYEDGTFSPDEVQEVIEGINHSTAGGFMNVPGALHPKLPPKDIYDCALNPNSPRCKPCPPAPTVDQPQCISWMGAQTTIQRWFLDPQVDNSNVDRTLRTVFTHDHFGPSTHQQAGLYAGLLVEPTGSTWTSNDGTTTFGSRSDGGPTSWQARILTKNTADSYREFMLEFQDLQLAYQLSSPLANPPARKTKPDPDPKKGWTNPAYAINAPSGNLTQSKPSLVTTGLPAIPAGTQSVNYLNEPLGFRVGSTSAFPPPSKFSDLSYAYDNSIQPTVNPLDKRDPMTPLLRAYQNDNVQVRLLVGAHVFPHQFNLAGPTWFAEPSWKNSGYRSAQPMGLSEHFELLFKVPPSSAPNINRKCPDGQSQGNCADYLYSPSMDVSGVSNGLWGLFRAYDPTDVATKLKPLPNNPIGAGAAVAYSTCPATLQAPGVKRTFNITAVPAQLALFDRPAPGKGQIVFNDRGIAPNPPNPPNPTDSNSILANKFGIMYVRTEDLKSTDPANPAYGKLKDDAPVEPLILRANAGDCIEVNLTNAIGGNSAVFQQNYRMAPPLSGSPYPTKASRFVGLHPQLLSYDAASSYGMNVGWNSQGQKDQVVVYGKTVKYQWYAGKIDRTSTGKLNYIPVEFGSLNLFPSDPVFQHINGLFGSMIIEPAGSKWTCDSGNPDCDPTQSPAATTRAAATITKPDGSSFREFALMISDDIIVSNNSASKSNSAVNYRTEPWDFRYKNNATLDFSCMLSNQLIQQAQKDPVTPIFRADIGDQVRFRMTHPFGTGNSQVFTVHGHVWQRNPYTNDSRVIGDNNLSQWMGSRDNHGSTDHFDMVIDKAGGEAGQAGDYLYSVFVPIQARVGPWGIFRVGNLPPGTQPNAMCKPVTKPGYVPPQPKDDLQRFQRPGSVKP